MVITPPDMGYDIENKLLTYTQYIYTYICVYVLPIGDVGMTNASTSMMHNILSQQHNFRLPFMVTHLPN